MTPRAVQALLGLLDCAIASHAPVPAYETRNPFAYSLRCAECLREKVHTQEVHDALRGAK